MKKPEMSTESKLIKELADNGTKKAQELFLKWQEERLASKQRLLDRLDALTE